MLNVLIVFGGMTSEHDLSCKSAGYIIEHIDKEKYNPISVGITLDGKWLYTEATPEEIREVVAWEKSITNKKCMIDIDNGTKDLLIFEEDEKIRRVHIDCVFARMAGNTGEDGKLQGLFEVAGVPYVGCNVAASACGMDKEISYSFADIVGIRRPKTAIFTRQEILEMKGDETAVEEKLSKKIGGYPMFLKPASAGSSMGISKVHSKEELHNAIALALDYDDKIIFEECINGKEIKVGMLGDKEPVFGELCEIVPTNEFNDYKTKYETGSSSKRMPANIPEDVKEKILELSLRYWKELRCEGFSRIDYFLTDDNEVVFNEINTMPGFKPTSLYPMMFEKIGISYTELISRLIEMALKREMKDR